MAAMTRDELQTFLDQHFPQGYGSVEAVGEKSATLRLAVGDEHLRPGGTVSGPAMMGLADTAMYVALLAQLGPVTQAVTTNLTANFLRRPAMRDLLAEARLLRVGRRLAVGEIAIHSEGDPEPVAHVTATYALPARD
ncbi:MAG TPA: PaaI family thioesterase [Gammaproteobacteria bacterium]|nr:PaaI family thioesterase [Gammaproteobacteria bacterium]